VALRDALAKLQAVTPLTAQERKAVDATLAAMDALIAVKDKIPQAYAELDAVRMKTIEAQALLIDRLTTALNKPKSGWDKFLDTLKTIGKVVVGIVIGRAF
jgi:hypothetical protein